MEEKEEWGWVGLMFVNPGCPGGINQRGRGGGRNDDGGNIHCDGDGGDAPLRRHLPQPPMQGRVTMMTAATSIMMMVVMTGSLPFQLQSLPQMSRRPTHFTSKAFG